MLRPGLLATKNLASLLLATLLAIGLCLAAPTAHADNGDCGQPASTGSSPTATDALFILNVAVGTSECDLCVCDVDDSGATTASDALRTLSFAVGVSVSFTCPACVAESLCTNLATLNESAEPFDTIDIGDVPESFESVWAVVTPQDGSSGFAGIRLDGEGGGRLMVPVHPTETINGGSVSVVVTDGSEECPVGTIDILPLPAAASETSEEVLGAFLGWIDGIAGDFGLTGDDLATTPIDELPVFLVPVALAQIALASPGNPDSLAAILAGTSDDAEGLDLDLLNRCLAKMGIADELNDRLANRVPITPGASTKTQLTANGEGDCEVYTMSPLEFDIDSAAELVDYMQEGLESRSAQQSLNTVVSDALAQLTTLVGLVNTAAGASGATLLFAYDVVQASFGNLYPSLLTDLQFQVENGGRIPEDRMDGPDDQPSPSFPQWTDPELFATNLGMELSPVAVEGLITAANFVPVNNFAGDLVKAGALEAINDILAEVDPARCINIPPTTWGPIGEARDEEYLTATYEGDSVVEIIDFGSFEPVALGTTDLTLKTTDIFTGPSITETAAIEVVRKQVGMQAATINTQPGQTVEVFAFTADSYRPEAVDWEYPAFLTDASATVTGPNEHKLTFTAPNDRMDYPFDVTAFSSSIDLPPTTPRREGTTEIRSHAEITIAPRGGCVVNGGTLDLEATVEGLAEGEEATIAWSWFGGGDVDPGEDNTAVYTAPESGSGETLIEAALLGANEVIDEITVTYGECDINLDLGWFLQSSTFDPDLPPDTNEMTSAYQSGPLFPQPGDKLMEPDQWWDGRSASIMTENGSTYLQPTQDDLANDLEISLSSSSTAQADFSSTSGSQAGLEFSWATAAECKSVPNSESRIECSDGRVDFSWVPVIRAKLTEPGTYEGTFTMDCTRNGTDGLFAVGARTRLYRHKGSAQAGSFPNSESNGPNISSLNPFDVPDPEALPFPVGQTNHVCDPSGEPVQVQASWEIGDPVDPEGDVIAFVVSLRGYFLNPVNPFEIPDPPAGSYQQSGTISASMTFERIGDFVP